MVPMSVELEEEADDLEEYTFPKFAATYFQGSSTHTHIRRQLRHPLLYHDDKDNVLVSCSLLLLNLLPPQPWLLLLPSSLGPPTSGTALRSRDFRAKQIVLSTSMKVVIPISIFWHFAGRHFTQIPAHTRSLITFSLPKERTLRFLLTPPATLWGQKQTGEKKHQSSSTSLLLLGLLVCELG